MDYPSGLSWTFLLVLTLCSCAHSSHLYLQPVMSQHAFFTGDKFFVTCFTTEDESVDRLRWTYGEDRPIPKDDTQRVYTQRADNNHPGLLLVFTKIESEDAGKYTCSDDENSVDIELIVYRAITFTDTPTVQQAPEGHTGVILCNVKADPKPAVNWYFEGVKIKDKDSAKYKINKENHSLKIENLNRNDTGKYKCKAFVISHLVSKVQELDIQFNVQFAPEVVGEKEVLSYGTAGHRKNLTCSVIAEPPPMFEWMDTSDMVIHNNTKGFVVFETHNSSTLQVPVDEDSFGEYTCAATNALGSQKVAFELKEGVVPGVPLLRVLGMKGGALRLQLRPHSDDFPKGHDLAVQGFSVEYAPAALDQPWEQADSQKFNIADQPYELRNLSSNSEYVLRAAAFNAAGAGNFSAEVRYKTATFDAAQVISGASPQNIFSFGMLLMSVALLAL